MSDRIALIAGAGRFPLYVAQAARRQGMGVVALGIRGWADPALSAHVDAYEELAVGALGEFIDRLKFHGVRRAIMAGKVTKDVWLTQRATFDAELAALVSHAPEASVTSLLGAIGQRLAREGITLLDSSTFLKADLCPAGVIGGRPPTEREQRDIRLGAAAARAMAALDIGQTVVVKDGVIIAVEALEGTDAAIRRAQALAGQGLVVVKMAAPAQDRRFDLPVVGIDTLTTLREAGVSCLAVEAGTTLLLDRDAVIASANASHICLLGVTAPAA